MKNKKSEMSTQCWKTIIQKKAVDFDKYLGNKTFSQSYGEALWSFVFIQEWLPGLNILKSKKIPGMEVLKKYKELNGKIDDFTDIESLHWIKSELNLNFSSKEIENSWFNRFFKPLPLPASIEIYQDFPLSNNLWSQALTKIIINPIFNMELISTYFPMGLLLSFSKLPNSDKEEIIEGLENNAHSELYGKSLEKYKISFQNFMIEVDKLILENNLPSAEKVKKNSSKI